MPHADAFLPLPTIHLAAYPTPIEALPRLREAIGGGPRLLVKRDDALGFAFGGNKVRKMSLVAADAVRSGADLLITSGGVQSNHARVTAAVAAKLGLRCILVANGAPQDRPTANALLDRLLGAEVRYVATRDERAPAMESAADEARSAGHHPYVIPIGASTPLGAAAFVEAIAEMLDQIDPPDFIVHSSSSGGTQAGLVAGVARAGIGTQVIGISADEPAPSLAGDIRRIMDGLVGLLGLDARELATTRVEVDDTCVGDGYGMPTEPSREAQELAARTEALFLDHTYTAKAMAGLIARVRDRRFADRHTVLFWHTGGQVGLFA